MLGTGVKKILSGLSPKRAPSISLYEEGRHPARASSALSRPTLLALLLGGASILCLIFALALMGMREASLAGLSQLDLNPSEGDIDRYGLLDSLEPLVEQASDQVLDDADLPINLSLGKHVLKRGETLGSVARRYGLSNDTLISINNIENVKRLKAGQSLKIPNMNGIVHYVGKGDTVSKIAARYKVSSTSILDANNLESYSLTRGQAVFIPGAKLDRDTLKQALGDLFRWPLRGDISSYFGYRNDPFTGARQFHGAIDIRQAMGARVNAAVDGTIAEVGYSTLYGNYIIMGHSKGIQTLFGHLSKVTVQRGQRVNQGEKIGEVGSTGYSTGPHLHFGVYKYGQAVNPLGYLGK